MRTGRPKRNADQELTVPMTFRVPLPVRAAVKEVALERNIDMSDVGREALEKHLAHRIRRYRRVGLGPSDARFVDRLRAAVQK